MVKKSVKSKWVKHNLVAIYNEKKHMPASNSLKSTKTLKSKQNVTLRNQLAKYFRGKAKNVNKIWLWSLFNLTIKFEINKYGKCQIIVGFIRETID